MAICIVCDDNCNDALPILSNGCKPSYKFAQFEDLFLSTQPFADYTAGTYSVADGHATSDFSAFVTDVQTRLGTGTTYNQVATADSIRKFCIEGDLTTDSTDVEVCKGKSIPGELTLTFTGTIKDVSYQNLEFVKSVVKCNPELYFLLGTRDDLYGGACAGDALVGFIKLGIEVANDRNALVNIPFSITIKQDTLPTVFPNVLA